MGKESFIGIFTGFIKIFLKYCNFQNKVSEILELHKEVSEISVFRTLFTYLQKRSKDEVILSTPCFYGKKVYMLLKIQVL